MFRPVKKSKTTVISEIDTPANHQWIASEAYFLAEKRGFAPGHELEDWVAAESILSAEA